jgi:predicted nucleotidyltransferase
MLLLHNQKHLQFKQHQDHSLVNLFFSFLKGLFFFKCILAQSCAFPFTFNSVTYTACTTDNDTQLWCSPSSVYTGQRLYCTSTGINSF